MALTNALEEALLVIKNGGVLSAKNIGCDELSFIPLLNAINKEKYAEIQQTDTGFKYRILPKGEVLLKELYGHK